MSDAFHTGLEGLTEVFREVEDQIPPEAQKAMEQHLEKMLKAHQEGESGRIRAQQIQRINHLLNTYPDFFTIDNTLLSLWERRVAANAQRRTGALEAIVADIAILDDIEDLPEPAPARPVEVLIGAARPVAFPTPMGQWQANPDMFMRTNTQL